MSVTINCRPDGPYLIDGADQIQVTDPTGAVVDLGGKSKIALCRCGASANRPFCDGTHSKVGFKASEPAKK